MNGRIAEVRKKEALSQEEFARRLNLSRNFVWMIEKGERVPSDRTVLDICREFKVNETWLRTGAGEMYRDMSRDEHLAEAFGRMLTEDDSDETTRLKKAIIGELMAMPPEAWERMLAFIKTFSGQ